MSIQIQYIITSDMGAFSTPEIQRAVQAIIDSNEGIANTIHLDGIEFKGWHINLNEVDLDDRPLEIFANGVLVDIYEPYDNHIVAVPVDWLHLGKIRPNNLVPVLIEEEDLVEPFSEDLCILTDTMTYKFGGIKIRPECFDDEDQDEE